MTEKRFSVQERGVVDNIDNETFEFSLKVDAEIICEKLNEIVDENEYLKSQLKEFKLLGVVENTLIYSVTK